jgi:hypothetical protein
MEENARRYIGRLELVIDAENLDTATDTFQRIAECVGENGGTLMEGVVSLAREREPVEAFTIGGDRPYKNVHAELGHKPAWLTEGATAGTGADH